MPERELILEYLELVDDVLDELGSREEVEYIRLDPRARHRRRPPAAGLRRNRDDLKTVVEYMVAETQRL